MKLKISGILIYSPYPPSSISYWILKVAGEKNENSVTINAKILK